MTTFSNTFKDVEHDDVVPLMFTGIVERANIQNEMDAWRPSIAGTAGCVVVAFGKDRSSRLITITRENGFDYSGATRQHLQAPGVNAGNPTFPNIPAPHVSP
jgi:hypothetical protein